MPLISYDVPTIPESISKPLAIANKSLPYNYLADSRRFEELLYSIYKLEIENKQFEQFDGITLMSGVREKGRDCVLLKEGKNYGLIQCKKYDKNYSKNEFGKEIIKFVLNSILEPTLIHNIDDFTYYMAVSSGFVLSCSNFIDDFNNKIQVETELNNWINQNISQPSLSSLKLKDRKEDVLNILTKIKVRKIIPPDLDILLLKKENQKILSLFFEVRQVTDNSVAERLEKKFENYYNQNLNKEELKIQLARGSINVKMEKNEFDGIPSSHIPRSETDELYNWINSAPVKDKEGRELNICLLAGNAGMGKTVILKDLYQRLLAEKIPTLALKADKLYAISIKQLQDKINLSIPLFDFIEQCKQQFPSTIILIDQIDALSQSISSDRSFLDTYLQLIETYRYDSAVRIIISVRIFDLYYDPSLRVYKNIKSIEVKKLEKNEVLSQLQKIGLTKDNISGGLLELLQVPNNLDVFSRIFKRKENFAGITSIQSLYSELWKNKIFNVSSSLSIKRKTLTKLIYKISNRMFEMQQITISDQSFENYVSELNYLKSERILTGQNNEIQFFHQSFYDYVFAKRFVESDNSIKRYLKNNDQSIMVRSALKMIISYLREFDNERYLKKFKVLINDKKIFFHIKHLLISTLAVIENPSSAEKKLLVRCVVPHKKYYRVFLEHVKGSKWLEYLLLHDKGEIRTNTEEGNVGLQVLKRNLDGNEDIILDYLLKTGDGNMSFAILYNITNWDSKSFQLFEKHCEFFKKEVWGYNHLLKNMAEYNPRYVLKTIQDDLVFNQNSRSSQIEYSQKEIVKKLKEKIPQDLIDVLFGALEKNITQRSLPNPPCTILTDFVVSDVDLREDEHSAGKEYYYKVLANSLRSQGTAETNYYKNFLKENIFSKYKNILRLIVFSLQTNEKMYKDEIFSLIIYLGKCRFFDSYGKLNFEIRNLLRSSFLFFNDLQKAEIIKTIKGLTVKTELHKWERDGKKFFSSQWGLTKYLFYKCLPIEIINQEAQLDKEFKELKRRFGDYQDSSGSKSWGGTVHASLTINAYKNMNCKEWLNSFKKYDTEDRSGNYTNPEDFLKGGLIEHSRAFADAVKNNPSKHIEIINCAIEDSNIPINYAIMGLDGLTKAGFAPEIIIDFLKKIIKKNLDLSNTLQCIWIAQYLVHINKYDKQVVDYLIEQALKNPNPEKEMDDKSEKKSSVNGLISSGINTVRGSAARVLVHIQDKKYENQVFETLETLFETDVSQVKAAGIFQFAYLMNVNKERTFNLFLKAASNNENEAILPSAIWSVQYFIHYNFEKLGPYFKKIIENENLGSDDIRSLSSILFASWLNEYPNSKSLFKQFLSKHPEAWSTAIRDSLQNFYFKEEISDKSNEVLETVINFSDQEVIRQFEIEFLHLDHIKFADISSFLIKYVQSESFKMSDYFLDYLTYNCSQNVCMSIDLFRLAIKNKNKIDKEERYILRYEERATKFIVGAFNLLRPKQIKKHLKYQTLLLKAFDKILKDNRFKTNAENVLEKVIE